jgi:uncharacterized protein YcbK (DUF882 family)
METSRRQLFRLACAAATAGLASRLSPALANIGPAARSLSFHNLHTGENVKVEYWVDGDYVDAALCAVNNVLRDFRTGDVHPIAPRLLDLLSHLNGRLETNAPFEVISGYRSPKTNAMLHEASSGVASNSLHMQGMAIDIRVPGRSLAALHATALALQAGGVGYYPTSDFVHVDVGRVRRW